MLKMRSALVSLTVLALVSAACGGNDSGTTGPTEPTGLSPAPTEPDDGATTPDDEDELAALVEAAEAEGTVTFWYSSVPETIQVIVDAFEEAYPNIDVIGEDLSSGPQGDRLSQELTAGQVSVDVIINSDFTQMEPLASEGHLVDVSTLPEAAAAQSNFVEDTWHEHHPIIGTSDVHMAYNPDVLEEDELPTSYEDLLDPKWEGMMSANDPSLGLGAAQYWINVLQTQGEDFFEALAEQDVAVVQASSQSIDLLLSGSRPLALQSSPFQVVAARGDDLPLEPWYGYGRVSVFAYYMGLIAEGPNPEAGKLFANWLLTEDGQCALACGDTLHASHEAVTDDLPFPPEYEIFRRENTLPDLDRTRELFDQHLR